MPGHLFVVQGDLRTLHCDHWLMPCDAGLSVSKSWNRTAAWAQIRDDLPQTMKPGQRVVAAPGWVGPRRPWPTQVASGSRTPAEWHSESVRQFLEAAASAAPRSFLERDRPLLGLPVVGTGYGGKRRWAGDVLRAILPTVYRFLATAEVDVALVTWSEEDFAAAQAARRACEADGADVWPSELTTRLRHQARRLALLAAEGKLVVFLGAGVSVSAGLPTWGQLLDGLAEAAGFDAQERAGIRTLGPLDRAQLVAIRLGRTPDGPDPGALGRAVQQSLSGSDGVSMAHQLLAGLPVREFITTNFDDCFERACAAIGRPVATLPYAPASGAGRWLLKMHGCVSAPADIVLTWQDYARYAQRSAALAGIVQAMLITRHMLFVGFSLDDENFRRIVDDVRRAMRLAPNAGRDRFGTAVALFANPFVEQLWGDDLEWLHLDSRPASAGSLPASARRFELFLDYLSASGGIPHHLLNSRFEAVLTPTEHGLREALEPVRAWLASQRDDEPTAVAARVARLLRELGDSGSD